MAREKVEFDVIGRDSSGSKTFRQVGDAAERAGDQVEDLGKKSTTAGEQVDDLGDKARRSGDQADDAGRQYRGLAAEIEATEGRVRSLAQEIDRTGNKDLFKDLRKQQSELRKLNSAKSLLPDMDGAGEEAASGFVARFVARLGPLMASAPIGPAGAAAGVALGAAAAPAVAAAISGAVVGAAGVGGVVGGVMLAARDPQVKAAGSALGTFIVGDLEDRASDFVPAVLGGIEDIRAGWQAIGPDLDRIFDSSRFVDPLVEGAVSGGQKLVAGLADAIDEADPVIDALGRGFDRVGEAAGDALSTMAQDADEGAEAIDDLTLALTRLIETSAVIVHAGANVKGWSDELDVAIDKGRYWLEDMPKYKGWLDLTADGFAVGSKEAEAYRAATTGTATAADFATLKMAGMSDAQITAADASGTFRAKTDEVNGALGHTPAKVEDAIGALRDWYTALDEMTGKNLGARQAQRDLEDAIDGATAAVKKNGATAINHGAALDINSAKGRANAAALDKIASEANNAYDAILDQTGSQDLANAAAERGRAKFIELARKMGLSESAAAALAGQLLKIKDRKVTVTADTSPALNSARGIVARINNMHARIKVSAEPSGGYGGSAHTGDGYSTGMSAGGPVIGPGRKGVDSEPRLLAPGEYVLPARDVDRLGGFRGVDDLRRSLSGGKPYGSAPAATGGGGGGLDEDRLARAFQRAWNGMTLVLDDRTGRTATLMARGV